MKSHRVRSKKLEEERRRRRRRRRGGREEEEEEKGRKRRREGDESVWKECITYPVHCIQLQLARSRGSSSRREHRIHSPGAPPPLRYS